MDANAVERQVQSINCDVGRGLLQPLGKRFNVMQAKVVVGKVTDQMP